MDSSGFLSSLLLHISLSSLWGIFSNLSSSCSFFSYAFLKSLSSYFELPKALSPSIHLTNITPFFTPSHLSKENFLKICLKTFFPHCCHSVSLGFPRLPFSLSFKPEVSPRMPGNPWLSIFSLKHRVFPLGHKMFWNLIVIFWMSGSTLL